MNKALREDDVELMIERMRNEISNKECRAWRGLFSDFNHLFWYVYAIGNSIQLSEVAGSRISLVSIDLLRNGIEGMIFEMTLF